MSARPLEERPELAVTASDGPEIVLDLATLRAACRDLKCAVASRAGLPALAAVRISPNGAGAMLEVTDLEATLRRPVPAAVRRSGDPFLVPFKALERFARVASTTVEITADDAEIVLRSGPRVIRVPSVDAADYPEIRDAGTFYADVDADVFADALRRVAVAAGDDETRHILTGVLVTPAAGVLEITATDSYRLATIPVGATVADAAAPILVPARVARIVAKQTRAAGRITIAVAEASRVTFAAPDGRTWTSRLIEGEFPAWRALLEVSGDELTYDAAEMAGALKAAGVVCTDTTYVTLACSAGRGLDVRAEAIGIGRFAERIPSGRFAGEAVEIALNPGYLADAPVVVGDEVSAIITTAERPALFSGAGARYLLMPIRVT